MSKYPELRAILLARFAKNCPWTVPFYDDPKTEEQMKRMGYKRMEDDKWEEQTRYIERQSGILATYAALTTHTLNAKAGIPTPYPLSFAWRWAARSLNHPAGGEIEAAMMATFLEVTNQALVNGYGRQAYKLVRVAVGGEWVAAVVKGPARGRLEVMGDEFSRTGRIGEEGFGAFVP
jgi:nucleoporin GLE1